MENKAIAKAENFSIAPISDDIAKIFAEEMDGLGPIPFDDINIPTGGGLAFEIPGEDPEHPDTAQALQGVIVYHHAVNTYWEKDFDGANNLPDCSSLDGKKGLDIRTGEIKDCAACPFNQFGSGKKGMGKACKNGHRVYLLRENEALPVLLTLPPTSLKSFRDYIAKRVLIKGKRSSEVLTTIKLRKEKNGEGIIYSACTFNREADLTEDQVAAVRGTSAWIKSIAASVPLADETMVPTDAAVTAEVAAKVQENGNRTIIDVTPVDVPQEEPKDTESIGEDNSSEALTEIEPNF